jgi:hypothetical protein
MTVAVVGSVAVLVPGSGRHGFGCGVSMVLVVASRAVLCHRTVVSCRFAGGVARTTIPIAPSRGSSARHGIAERNSRTAVAHQLASDCRTSPVTGQRHGTCCSRDRHRVVRRSGDWDEIWKGDPQRLKRRSRSVKHDARQVRELLVKLRDIAEDIVKAIHR